VVEEPEELRKGLPAGKMLVPEPVRRRRLRYPGYLLDQPARPRLPDLDLAVLLDRHDEPAYLNRRVIRVLTLHTLTVSTNHQKHPNRPTDVRDTCPPDTATRTGALSAPVGSSAAAITGHPGPGATWTVTSAVSRPAVSIEHGLAWARLTKDCTDGWL